MTEQTLVRHRVSRLAVALAGCVLVLAGCSDPQQAAYTSVTDGKLTVDRPTAWTTPVTVDAPWTTGYRPGPDSIQQLQVSGDFGEYATAGQAVGTLIGQAQLKLANFTVVETRDVKVPGASTAQVVRYTITDNQKSQLSGEWIVAAHWPYPQSVAISVLTPTYDQDLEQQLLESMRMRPATG